jgi:hypothetical protein
MRGIIIATPIGLVLWALIILALTGCASAPEVVTQFQCPESPGEMNLTAFIDKLSTCADEASR